MRQLNILQVTNRIPYPLNDGGNLATYNVTKYLNRFGHKVTMAAINTRKHFQDPAVMVSVADIHAAYVPADISASGLLLSLGRKMPYNVERFISEDFRNLLMQLLSSNTYDVIQVEGIYLVIYIDVFRKYSSAPVVLRSHNIEYQIWERLAQKEKNLIKKTYLKILSKKIRRFEMENFSRFDGIVAITDQDALFYRENGYAKPLKVINAGVDLEMIKPSEADPEPCTVCFLGSLEWQPNAQGLEWFIEKVWPLLSRTNKNITFHIAGKNASQKFKELAIEGITFHGMVDDAYAFLQKYQVVIVPLFSGGGMRLKIVESMALGKCIVSTLIGAEGIDYEDGKHLLIADDAKTFARHILCLIEQDELRKSVSGNASQLAREKYDWQLLVREFENFYFQLI
ncbi:MAG: glycosyltransferase family 4 protein [Cytophagaceae bacterium]